MDFYVMEFSDVDVLCDFVCSFSGSHGIERKFMGLNIMERIEPMGFDGIVTGIDAI